MFRRLLTGTVLSCTSLLMAAIPSYATPTEPVTVDVYGASYSVEPSHQATDRMLRNQPWWGNQALASELCKALVYEGNDVASVGFNTMEVNGEDYIEAYLVMPNAICSGPIVVSQADIGEMTAGTFFVVSDSLCLTDSAITLNAQVIKNNYLRYQNVSILNCGYFNPSILY